MTICNDKQEYLIEMLNGVKNGYELPEVITEEQYTYIKNHKDEDKVLTGFVGFGCSFGGKWFGGYCRHGVKTERDAKRNACLESKRSLLKDIVKLKNTNFTNLDYRNVNLTNNCVVYCDPPYENTMQAYGLDNKFNSNEFWNYMREISKTHNVYISEQTAPDDFICIWEKPFTRMLNSNKDKIFIATEKLFVHKSKV